MAAVTVLTSGRIDMIRLERQLAREGFITAQGDGGLQVRTDGESSAVDMSMATMDGLSDDVFDQAVQLMGRFPRAGLRCVFDGPIGQSEAWPTVVAIPEPSPGWLR